MRKVECALVSNRSHSWSSFQSPKCTRWPDTSLLTTPANIWVRYREVAAVCLTLTSIESVRVAPTFGTWVSQPNQ